MKGLRTKMKLKLGGKHIYKISNIVHHKVVDFCNFSGDFSDLRVESTPMIREWKN